MDLGEIGDLFQSFGKYAQKEFGFKKPPTLNLVSDHDNSLNPLGKTAFYDPQDMSISIFVDGRHSKDILRSLAHELVHHTQNEENRLDVGGYHGEGYAQKNPKLRTLESEAMERGNMCLRDWEDQLKQQKPTTYKEWRNKDMSTKNWKNNELMENLAHKFGLKMDLSALNEAEGTDADEEADAEAEKENAEKEDEKDLTEETSEKYDDNPALKGGQSKLPDGLQKAIINKGK